jgi:hypothetical protein
MTFSFFCCFLMCFIAGLVCVKHDVSGTGWMPVERDARHGEPRERGLEMRGERAGKETRRHRQELGGNGDGIVGASLQRAADDLLRLALRVDFGGVEEGDALVDRGVVGIDAVLLQLRLVGVLPLRLFSLLVSLTHWVMAQEQPLELCSTHCSHECL